MNNKNKTYGGIIGHAKQAQIDAFIWEKKINESFRAIAEGLKKEFKLSISYVTVSSYYKDVLGGIDEAETIEGDEAKPSLDNDLLEKILDKFPKDEIHQIYGNMLALCSSNIEAFKEGKERLKPELVRYLKDVRAIIKEAKV